MGIREMRLVHMLLVHVPLIHVPLTQYEKAGLMVEPKHLPQCA
jgi:hypothetical protein